MKKDFEFQSTSICQEGRWQEYISNNGTHLCLEGIASCLPPLSLYWQAAQEGSTATHLKYNVQAIM